MKYRFLVTCATGDIGRELCLYLAKKGHDLIITARNAENLKALSEEIKTLYPGRKIDFYCAHLGSPDSMKELISQAKTIGIDGVVLMPPRPPLLPSDPLLQVNALTQAMQDCLIGPRFLLQELLPSMEKSELKSVVVMSGASSKEPIVSAEYEAFNVVRTAWVGCLKTFSDIQGPNGFRFNTISPGQVLTPTYKKKLETEAQTMTKQYAQMLKEKTATIPLRKLASIHDVVKSIYFFLKSSGAQAITANNIHIDGGNIRPYH